MVGTYPHMDAAQEYALVVLAMGLPCWIEVHPGSTDHHLLVAPEAAQRVKDELAEYTRELRQASGHETIDHGAFAHSPGWGHYLLWLVVLMVVHRLQPRYPELVEYGASSSIGLIEHGQIWRPFTALFLHADMEHLLGNLLSGLFFSTLVASSIGAWRGWLLILGCGAVGNAITSALVWPDPFRSIGASTAVFAALGILSGLGLAWMFRFRKQVPWLRIIAPLIGGIVVLGMTGSGAPESNTDVLGHVFGFVAGVIAGGLVGSFGKNLSYKASSGTSKAESDART